MLRVSRRSITTMLAIALVGHGTMSAVAGPVDTGLLPAEAGQPEEIAFAQGNAIKAIEPSSGSMRTVVEGPYFNPAWSPDGQLLAMVGVDQSNRRDIYVIDADGSNLTKVTSDVDSEGALAWSPDGRTIAYEALDIAGGTYRWDIRMIDLSTGAIDAVVTHPFNDRFPSFSPDGEQITFSSDREGFVFSVYTAAADGSGQSILVAGVRQTSTSAVMSAWSPTGDQIAFSMGDLYDVDIWVVGSDGQGARKVADDAGYLNEVDWSSDGTRVAFHDGGAWGGTLYVSDVASPELDRSALVSGGASGASWRSPVAGCSPDEPLAYVGCAPGLITP